MERKTDLNQMVSGLHCGFPPETFIDMLIGRDVKNGKNFYLES